MRHLPRQALRLAGLLAALHLATASAGNLAANPSGVERVPAAAWQDPAHGVVIVATAAAGVCRQGLWMHFYDLAKKDLVDGAPFVPIDLLDKSDFEGHYGALSAVVLPPGRYAAVVTFTTPLADTTSAPAFHFEVFAGEVTYLGRVRKHGDCDSDRVQFDIADRHQIDIEEASARARDPKGPARAVTRLMTGD